MSYILDALRKSDQQRQRGTTPTLPTAPATAAEPKQPAFLMYGLLAATLLGAGMVVGWLRPWQPEQPALAVQPSAARPLESGPHQTAPAPQPALPIMTRKPGLVQELPAPATPSKALIASPEKSQTPLPEKPAKTGLNDPAREPRVMAMADLPLSIQQEIPNLPISLHAYSVKPKDRLVSIDNRLLREGESPAPGIRLEQITPDGMIFSYKGYLFRHGVR
jgi:general secretion pathway protein B